MLVLKKIKWNSIYRLSFSIEKSLTTRPCNIAYHCSAAVFCMLYRSRCNPMHPVYRALPAPPVQVRVTHQYTMPPLCRTSQYHRTLIPCQCLCGTILLTLYSMVCDWWVVKARRMLFHCPKLLTPFLSSTVFLFSYFFLRVGILQLGFLYW